MKYRSLIFRASLASLMLLFCFQPLKAKAEWFRPLPAGKSAWVKWNLGQGSYVLEANTLLNVGDVDIEVYDSTGRNLLLKSNKLGGEVIPLRVSRGGTFLIKYSMPLCINPFGPCAVEINIKRTQ